jgi:hypothetical protein
MGCYLPLCSWLAYAPSAKSEALVLKRSGFPASKIRKHGSTMLAFLSVWKASSASLLYSKDVSF